MQSKITSWDISEPDRLAELTTAEREVWEKVEEGDFGVRSFARFTHRSPGTIGNLLARARDKLEEESA